MPALVFPLSLGALRWDPELPGTRSKKTEMSGTMLGMRRHLVWPIGLPLAMIGLLAGHSFGYRAAVPDAHAREHLLASSGHGYLDYAPLVVGVCAAAAVLGFVAAVVGAFFGRDRRLRVQIRLIAAVPPLAFMAQEFAERYLQDGHVHWQLVLSGPFLLGLTVQVPFALLAAAIALALGGAARRVAAALRCGATPRVARGLAASSFPNDVDLSLERVLARGYAGRGPPLVSF